MGCDCNPSVSFVWTVIYAVMRLRQFAASTQKMDIDHENHAKGSPILPAGIQPRHILDRLLQSSTVLSRARVYSLFQAAKLTEISVRRRLQPPISVP